MSDQATTNDIIETLNALRSQEESCYCTRNGVYSDPSTPIDGKCRELMVGWCYRIADHCNYNHNTVTIAVNNLDRLVEVMPEILESKRKFQLAVMTCLYNAVKTHEPIAIGPKAMARLSKGVFTAEDYERFEIILLCRLKWRVNAPTPATFAQLFMKLVPLYQPGVLEQQTSQLIQYQIDHATTCSDFLGLTAYELAYQATCNAISVVHPCAYQIVNKSIGPFGNTQLLSSQTNDALLNLGSASPKYGPSGALFGGASSPPAMSQTSVAHLSPRTVTLR